MHRPSKQNCGCGNPMSQVAKQCLDCRRKRVCSICQCCGLEFKHKPSQPRLSCSTLCAIKLRGVKSGATQRAKRKKLVCQQCGKTKLVAQSYSGRKFCSVACSALGKTGERSHQWKGGITSAHLAFFGGSAWKSKCRDVWRRDNGHCQRCKERCIRGEVHHIASWARHADLRLADSNLALLCYSCHKFVHSKRNTDGEFLHRPCA